MACGGNEGEFTRCHYFIRMGNENCTNDDSARRVVFFPFTTPRSNASDGGYGVTLACVDFGEDGPNVEIRKFDGVNWEKSFKETSIANESK